MAFKSYFFINKVGEKRPTAPRRTKSTRDGTVLPAPVSDPALWTDTDRYAEGGIRQFPNDLEMRCEVTANWLRLRQEEKLWTTGLPGEGVVMKQAKGHYICCPRELKHDKAKFYEMAAKLNVRVAMTITTRVIKVILGGIKTPYVELVPGIRIQVLPSMEDLPRCQKHQTAAFIASEKILVVWDDGPRALFERAEYIEDNLMKMFWRREEDSTHSIEWKKSPFKETVKIDEDEEDVEETGVDRPRHTKLNNAFACAAALIFSLSAIGGGWAQIAIEIIVDGNYMRILFVLCIIPQMWLALFFFQALAGNIAQLIGPVGQLEQNSKYYSGIPPRRLPWANGLPHVTIQMPVYKEGLRNVIAPTIQSVKEAIRTYELQGGTANIFINDDGMQVISAADAQERQDFYEEHSIGWVSRPEHNPEGKKDGPIFNRPGRFKKASNMNYALWVSVQVEEELAKIDRHEKWTKEDEEKAYRTAFRQVLEATDGEAWGEGNIRVGDYILLIDSDTRIPADCFHEAVSEMDQSPQVAVLQYSSGVMNVTENFFEKGITFFTNLVYTQIRYAVANGDVAPFVGHNAWLRWSAIQDIAYSCPTDNREKYWSEMTVSEDFDMALRLQTTGYIVRLGAYKADGYQEGVSLTVYDELTRWEKYAYGCSELIFHPLKSWITKGPFTTLFLKFLASPIPLPSKFSIMAYIGTYYALGSAWILTIVNYFLVGWYNGFLDHYYIDSFKVYFAIIGVFTALGNISLAVLRYRTNEKGIFASLLENLMWVPLLMVFLGGVSIHISHALLAHLFSVEMTWGSTAKEIEKTPFFKEIPSVIQKFKYTFLACIVGAAGMVCLAFVVPDMWRITFFTPVWPLSCVIVTHFLLPIVLNPNLMLFTW